MARAAREAPEGAALTDVRARHIGVVDWKEMPAVFRVQSGLIHIVPGVHDEIGMGPIGLVGDGALARFAKGIVAERHEAYLPAAWLARGKVSFRDRLTAGMFVSSNEENPVGAIELALAATLAADPIEAKIKEAVKSGRFSVTALDDRVASAQAAGIVTADEATTLRRAQRLVDKVIRVDDFPPDLGASEMQLSAPGPKLAHKAAA